MKGDMILLSHGAGGKHTWDLVNKMFLPSYGNPVLQKLGDGAVLDSLEGDPVLTTDSYVVRPYFFPEGTVGSLAVNGTVNDLLMCGAHPRALSVGLILEEGLPVEDLRSVCDSIGKAAKKAGVQVVTGDTKVVEKGHGDGIYINTTGLGERAKSCSIDPGRVSTGDKILINGPVGQHGVAILAAREKFPLKTHVQSDSRALTREVKALLSFGDAIRVLHDPTRGGLAGCLNEIANESKKRVLLYEERLPRDQGVENTCELLGFDPLYLANEGKVVAVVSPEKEKALVDALKEAGAAGAESIGEITEGEPLVVAKSPVGGERVLDILAGDPLPRIC